MAEGQEECGALLTWLQTLVPPPGSAAPPDVASGVPLALALHRIDPSWFDAAWLGRIRGDPGGDARKQVSNLRQVRQSVLEYWHQVLAQPLPPHLVPDSSRPSDPDQLDKLVRLVLGCAVCCPRREEHIQRMLGLPQDVQRELMGAIQELLDPEPPSPDTCGNFDAQSRRYYYLSQVSSEEAEPGAGQRCRELELQVAALQEDKAHLAAENLALREHLEGGAAAKLQRLQAQVEELQEENDRLESGREELRARCAHLEQEARGRQVREEELSALRDEVEQLRAASARAGRLEAALAAYRGRAAATGELRRWLRALQEQHAAQVSRAAHLEQQLGHAQAERAQLEAARRQVQELSGQREEAAQREQRWHLELQHLRERLQHLSQDRQRLLEERDALREANEELRGLQVQRSHLSPTGVDGAPPQNLAAEILPAELRAALTRLRRENRRLRLQRERLRHRLEAAGAAPDEVLLLDDAPEDLEELLEEEEEEEEPPKTGSGFWGSPQKPSESFGDPPGTPPLAPVLRLLRNQIWEKEELIRHLQGDWERDRAQREREERLLVTAWYNMGLALQRQEGAMAAARGSASGAQSFLAQQRLARRARTPHSRAPST